MSTKAVIFDLDGTLLNTLEDIAGAVNHALGLLGLPLHTVEEFKYFVGNGTDIMLKRALPADRRDDGTLETIKPLYVSYYDKHSDDNTRPYDGIFELLSNLKAREIKLAVTSNKIDCMVDLIVKNYFADTFDYVTGQSDGVPPKPDITMVKKAMDSLSVLPSECIYVGDSGVDAKTGKNVGAFTVGVKWGFRPESELLDNGADVVISQPIELLKYLK